MYLSDLLNESDISSSARLVGYVIGSYVNRASGDAYPAIRTIAQSANLSPTTVQKAVKELESCDIITIKTVRKYGSNVNLYKFHVPVSDTPVDTPSDTPVDTPVDVSVSGTEPIKPIKPKKEEVNLPDFIKQEDWNDYLAMRIAKKKPAQDNTKLRCIKRLENIHKQGYDVSKVMQKSIDSLWLDFFPKDEDRISTITAIM